MTNQERKTVREEIVMIATMSLHELTEYEHKLSMSMLSSKAKDILYRAVEQSRIHDNNYNSVSLMATSSNIESIA